MPKYIDKYIIERTTPVLIDLIEHYEAKQKESYKNFVLKRLKIDNDHISSTTSLHSFRQCPSEEFQQLTNETLILKLLDHNSIPKCSRVLKTNNSIYFVYSPYSLISLQEYLLKNPLSFEAKIEVSTSIISTVDYIHRNNVAYRGLNGNNVKIDKNQNIFLTNFTRAKQHQNIDQKLKSLNEAKKQSQFKALINEDLVDLAKLLLEIFNLREINPKYHNFKSEKERKLYQALSQILQKKFNLITLQNFVNILTLKETLKTKTCTSTTSSSHSINLRDLRTSEKGKISRQIFPISRCFSKSFSNLSLAMRTSKKKENGSMKLESTQLQQLKYKKLTSPSSTSNLLKFQKLSWSDQLNSVVEKFEKEKQIQRKQVKNLIFSILTTRKIINLVLHCLKSINNQFGFVLIILLTQKCEYLALKQKKQVEKCLLQSITIDQREALRQIKKQNIKTIVTLQIVRQSLKQLSKLVSFTLENKLADLMQISKNQNQKLGQKNVQQRLSDEIYAYLKKQASPSLIQEINNLNKNKDSKNSKLQEVQLRLYESFRNFYYLSIKLKYRSFEDFFEKKNDFQTQQFSILKDDYFMYFETGKIPLHKIANEVIFRVEIYEKNKNKYQLNNDSI